MSQGALLSRADALLEDASAAKAQSDPVFGDKLIMRVVGHRRVRRGKKNTDVFVIFVDANVKGIYSGHGGTQITIERGLKNFKDMLHDLQETASAGGGELAQAVESLPGIPSQRGLLTRMFSKLSTGDLENHRQQLDAFIKAIASSDNLRNQPSVARFVLGRDRPVSSGEDSLVQGSTEPHRKISLSSFGERRSGRYRSDSSGIESKELKVTDHSATAPLGLRHQAESKNSLHTSTSSYDQAILSAPHSLLDLQANPLPFADSLERDTGETIMMYGMVRKLRTDASLAPSMLVLTHEALYKLHLVKLSVVWRLPICDLHSVGYAAGMPLAFKLYTFGTKLSPGLVERQYVCEIADAVDDWVIALSAVLGRAWRRLFEEQPTVNKRPRANLGPILPPNEVYQAHYFLTKKNRRGKMQQRFILLSDTWLYNLRFTFHPTTLKEFLWALPIDCVTGLTIFTQSPRVLLLSVDPKRHRAQIDNDHAGSKYLLAASKIKSSHKFILRSIETCIKLVDTIRLLHSKQTGEVIEPVVDTEKCINVTPFSTKKLWHPTSRASFREENVEDGVH